MIKVRKARESDRELLAEKIAADPIHIAAGITPDFFFMPDVETLAYEDEQGVVFFIRLARALRIDMQFCADEKRTAIALKVAFVHVSQKAKESRFKEIIFNSTSEKLTKFCKVFMGFAGAMNEWICKL